MKGNLIVFCVLVTIAFGSATNYCEKPCKDYRTNSYITHIACGHSNRFSTSCPKNAKLVPTTRKLKNLIVAVHNKKRNFIAGGGDSRYRPACRMATMQWDEELAKLAALNVKKCEMEHDACHNTDAFEYSGQNLAYMTFFDKANHTTNWKEAVEMWYGEVENSTQSHIDKYPENYNGTMISHFTVMMADRNTHVGCAASTYTRNNENIYLIACNYATTNMIGQPIYESCSRAGKKCTTGMNKKQTNLCSKNEQYEVNKWF